MITVKELHELLKQNADIVVFDCRFKLADKPWGEQQYLSGHIEHAQYLDLEKDLSSLRMEHGGRHPFPDTQEFVRKLGKAGVDKASTVVVYDSGEGMATRAWWLIRYFGHKDVRVLDGGLKAWIQEGYPLTTDKYAPAEKTFVPNIHTDWIVDYETVRYIALGNAPQKRLIDARAAKRYLGEVEPMDKTPGHIPTAANAPWQEGINESGFWRAPDLQRKRFENLVSEKGDTIVYCGSGVTACADLFAMELAGIKGAKLYPGSWSDWISYPDSPVATGEEKK